MKIRAKLIMGMLLLLAAICVGVVSTVQGVLIPELVSLEKQSLFTELERVDRGLKHELSRLQSLTIDWGVWDDTYEFVADRNDDYRSSNLVPSFLEPIYVDALLIQNNSGEIVASLFSDKIVPESAGFLAAPVIDKNNPLYALSQPKTPATSILLTNMGVAMIAAHPIVDGMESKPPRGTFYMVRLLDDDFATGLREQLQLPLSFTVASGTPGTSVRFVADDQSSSTLVLPVANSTDRLLQIELVQSRPFYKQALSGVLYTVAVICLVGLSVTLIAYHFLNRTLVEPIEQLKGQAEAFGRDAKAVVFENSSRNDELGELANTFMQMAKSVELGRQLLQRERNQFLDASLTDPMTGLRNRRFLEQYLSKREHWAEGQGYLMMIMDIDLFKKVNDTYGHDVGDVVIKQFAQRLQQCCRSDDLLVRTGGEEYALVSLDCERGFGEKLAERICRSIADRSFGPEDMSFNLTCSVGFYVVGADQVSDPVKEWPEMMKVADLALYAVKNSGRNNWIGLGHLDGESRAVHPQNTGEIERGLRQKQLRLLSHDSTAYDAFLYQA